jgi:predicted Zn-dependent peptidase
MYEISRLDNGLTVATYSVPNAQSVALGVWIGVGGRYEPKNYCGISHFAEHMVFKGTRTRTYRQIKESVEGLGGLLNGFTAEEMTCYMAKVLPAQTLNTLDVLIDIITDPLLKSADIKKERSVIFEEIKMYYDLPHHLAYDRLLKLLWPNHPLGRNLAGNFSSLKIIDRSVITDFMRKFYTFDNILITACGNISHFQALEQLNKVIKTKKPRKGLKKHRYQLFDHVQTKPQTDIMIKDIHQTHLCLGMRSLPRIHPLRYALTVLHVILGANMSSRLFNEVREKKAYAYEIATSIKRFKETGAFIVHAGVLTDKVEKALGLILHQLYKLVKKNVSKSELQRAKIYCRGQLLMGNEDTLDHMNWLGESMMKTGKPEYVEDVIKNIDMVSASQVRSLAKKIFNPKNFNLLIVGSIDESKQAKIKNLLRGF